MIAFTSTYQKRPKRPFAPALLQNLQERFVRSLRLLGTSPPSHEQGQGARGKETY